MVVICQSIVWLIFGIIVFRYKLVSRKTPRTLGRILFKVGIPLKIFLLASQSDFSNIIWLPPLVMLLGIFLGFVIALLILRLFEKFNFNLKSRTKFTVKPDVLATRLKVCQFYVPTNPREMGGFVLASILGNTGSVGLNLVPLLISENYWSWVILFGVAHLVFGSFGFGVSIADYYSPSTRKKTWPDRIVQLLFLPSIWAFVLGCISRKLFLPSSLEKMIERGVLLVLPGAFALIGMELSRFQHWKNIRLGIFPTLVKMLFVPGTIGLILTNLGIEGDQRLVMVLMSSMPTATTSSILSETYNLDSNIVTSSILLSTLSLPFFLLLWFNIF